MAKKDILRGIEYKDIDFNGLPEYVIKKKTPKHKQYLSGERILPKNITGKESLEDLIGNSFMAYNSARLKEGCRLFSEKMLGKNVTVGMTLAGALTPAGLGASSVVPLINAGFVDWIIATGANMYHDLHFAFNAPLHAGSHLADDAELQENQVVRIYDIYLGYLDCLISTDEIFKQVLWKPEFQKEMGTAEFYHKMGKYADAIEKANGLKNVSVMAAAYRAGVPIYTSSPGDSTLGMDIAGMELQGIKLRINPSIDVNETASIVLAAKRSGGKSAVLLIGGGSPKNFMLQTEPQIQEVLRLKDFGHDYFFQVTDARPDTGGLSGATPSEAVSWGKVDPKQLPDAVVCYMDSTIALPIITHYALSKHKKRALKKLFYKREEFLHRLTEEYFRHNKRLNPKS